MDTHNNSAPSARPNATRPIASRPSVRVNAGSANTNASGTKQSANTNAANANTPHTAWPSTKAKPSVRVNAGGTRPSVRNARSTRTAQARGTAAGTTAGVDRREAYSGHAKTSPGPETTTTPTNPTTRKSANKRNGAGVASNGLSVKFRLAACALCAVLMLGGCLVGAAAFARPTTSDVEKRELTQFPTLTWDDFWDGTFFSNVALWYSDTFPNRDSLIAMSNSMKNSYGIQTGEKMVGGATVADDIPSETAASSSEEAQSKVVEVPENYSFDADMQNQIMSGLYVKDGAAYSIYYFVQDAADVYIQALNKAAADLEGTTNVYSVLVPNSSSVLSDEEYQKLGGSDQRQAIDYYYNSYQGVTGIDVLSGIQENRDDYLYFRTDHHWTALGAYQAYKAFCEEKGWEAASLDSFETKRFEPFLGTLYNELNLTEMAENPDYVDAYIPNATNDMTYWDDDGSEIQWNIVYDVSDWSEGSGYYCFIGGDKPLSIINNPTKEEGDSVLVIKESFGNCFVPYLVDHYKTVYIADFRYTDINIVDFCKENNITDVIFENNVSIIGSESVASKIYSLIDTGGSEASASGEAAAPEVATNEETTSSEEATTSDEAAAGAA